MSRFDPQARYIPHQTMKPDFRNYITGGELEKKAGLSANRS
jgi:hypothetical protein